MHTPGYDIALVHVLKSLWLHGICAYKLRKEYMQQFHNDEMGICYLLVYLNVPYIYFSKPGALLVLLFDQASIHH